MHLRVPLVLLALVAAASGGRFSLPMRTLADARAVGEVYVDNFAESVAQKRITPDTAAMFAEDATIMISSLPGQRLSKQDLLEFIPQTYFGLDSWMADTVWAVPSGNRVMIGQFGVAVLPDGCEAEIHYTITFEFNAAAEIELLTGTWDYDVQVEQCGMPPLRPVRHVDTIPDINYAKLWHAEFMRAIHTFTGGHARSDEENTARVKSVFDAYLAGGARVTIGNFSSTDRAEIVEHTVAHWAKGTKTWTLTTPPTHIYADDRAIVAYLVAYGTMADGCHASFVWSGEWRFNEARKLTRMVHLFVPKLSCPHAPTKEEL